MVQIILNTVRNGDVHYQVELKIPAPHLAQKQSMGEHFTHLKDNLRLFTKTSRESKEWKIIYSRRTSIERSNKREKVDYNLEAGRHRSTQMWYIRTYGIMICQHLDAWFSHLKSNIVDLKSLIFSI